MLDDPVFNLEIVVTDKKPDHRDTATVIITIEDFNDEAPEFEDNHKTV